MALKYNLAKVYALSDNDPDFVNEILNLFITEVPTDLQEIKDGIENKDYKKTYAHAHKMKPTLDLLGLNVAFEEILQVEAWTRAEGKKKEIIETFKSINSCVGDAIKEIKKDFSL